MLFRSLSRLAQDPRHQFWPDDISLLTSEWIETDRIIVSRQVADTCLLALASVRGAQLATFDRRLVTDAVKGGQRALHLIQP